MSSIERLRHSRDSIKAMLVKLMAAGDAALRDRAVIAQFDVRYVHLEDLRKKVDEIHKLIEEICFSEDSTIAMDAEERELQELIDLMYSIDATQRELHPPVAHEPLKAEVVQQPAAVSGLKFHKISIPVFSGKIGEWKSFADLFTSSVRKQSCYSPAEKLQVLRLHLSDEPLRLVRNLPVTDDNFFEAWAILERRYDKPRLIIRHHINKILDLPELRRPNAHSLNSFVTDLQENLAALRVLNVTADDGDQFLLNILLRKVDMETRRGWEIEHADEAMPSAQSFIDYLENSVQIQRCLHHDGESATLRTRSPARKTQAFLTMKSSQKQMPKMTCAECRSNHMLYQCPRFKTKSVAERQQLVNSAHLCPNCLSSAHPIQKCRSSYRCRYCQAAHHSLLHQDPQPAPPVTTDVTQQRNSTPLRAAPGDSTPTPHGFSVTSPPTNSRLEPTTALVSRQHSSKNCSPSSFYSGPSELILLGTVRVAVTDCKGERHLLRALIDSGSQHNYISALWADKLGLPRSPKPLRAYGLGMTPVANISDELHLVITPVNKTAPAYEISAAITETIGSQTPQLPIDISAWVHLQRLELADPFLGKPGAVDLLIGAKLFPHILLGGRICGPVGTPSALETSFGWLVIGEIATTSCLHLSNFHTEIENESIAETLQRFWEIEEVPPSTVQKPLSAEEELCEKLYVNNVTRDANGRYSVALPFRHEPPRLGDSYGHALACYRSLRRRLRNDPETKQQYDEFLADFLSQGHMRLVSEPQVNSTQYYIPHLCVLRPSSTTTKLRVVFNASKRTTNGVSLNDTLLPGPPLQTDIREVLLRFRKHRYAFIGDLKQMFRQIRVAEPHRKYQQILWNFDDSEFPRIYELTTVTFGMTSSPYLAMRTLRQLAEDERTRFPEAAVVLERDIYVDDLITGSSTLASAIDLRKQLTALCSSGHFLLRKFAASNPELLPTSDCPDDGNETNVNFDADSTVKVLGIRWMTSADCFAYSINPTVNTCSKRAMLSEIARIFDPLGWLTPVTMFTKRLLQILWTLSLDWDDAPPKDIEARWRQFQDQLPALSAVRIPRHYGTADDTGIALVGFCDASEAGYAAVIYGVPLPFAENNQPILICAKGRVAPLKRVSIPRLELCAAVLLARLLRSVQDSLKLKTMLIYAFSDSTVALTWIGSMPYRWKTYVSNRVTEIQENVHPQRWFHVRTDENPADVASRGSMPYETLRHPLWWNGPSWLRRPASAWPLNRINAAPESSEEVRSETATLTLRTDTCTHLELIERFSTIPKLLRVLAYCRRFALACRQLKRPTEKYITVPELQIALRSAVKLVQSVSFTSDLQALRKGEACSRPLRKLNPFLDDTGIIRVGGRLCNAQLQYTRKHPLLLPAKHHLTDILIDYYHQTHLHAGPQALHAALAAKFWIISAKQRIRARTRKCIRCFRVNPTNYKPFQGNLPEHRVTCHRAFEVCGTDMAGPLNITSIRARGVRSVKAYICIFVCFATKAIHLELVSDLSTDAFIAAFRRFTARRGPVLHLYSDCGRNFIGAHRFFKSVSAQSDLALRGVTWHFNPPSAPHFGGLWEAGVKATKYHLKRIVGEQILSYEEITTLLSEIEAQLNSRPLVPASNDPNDLQALTPSQFLSGEITAEPAEVPVDGRAMTLQKRWELINNLRRSFWSRWRREYLHTLQQRSRWISDGSRIDIGHLVLVQDDNLPPTKWKLGRIIRTIPGSDGVVRVAEVRTATGTLLRPVVKLAPLPLHD